MAFVVSINPVPPLPEIFSDNKKPCLGRVLFGTN